MALFSLVGVGLTVAELEDIANNELITEINNAAGLALVNEYAASMTVEQLEDLAANGRTVGLRLAGREALKKVTGSVSALASLTVDELLALGQDGDADAGFVYALRAFSGFDEEGLEAFASDTANSDALQRGAGEFLGALWTPGGMREKSVAELLDIVENGATAGIRYAAGVALKIYWIATMPLDRFEVEAEILNTLNTDLAEAYQGYLAYLYAL
jgi:hypothetical protein